MREVSLIIYFDGVFFFEEIKAEIKNQQKKYAFHCVDMIRKSPKEEFKTFQEYIKTATATTLAAAAAAASCNQDSTD